MTRVRQQYTVANSKGIHGRVATRLAEIGRDFELELLLNHGGREVACDSILDVLSLAVVHGSTIELTIMGARAQEALTPLAVLFNSANDPE
ncbi:HPr family phosphocarrier protein [Desulfogranum mediterraneum]|uniref:HPr family phosphocarrier protein n=1 Tax=Desulfogranum mediterraneum TaxID=160661 RepID=UPI0003FB5691|nr:HPr family phosphocarrier protein [Desulfogranum mediterraneum]